MTKSRPLSPAPLRVRLIRLVDAYCTHKKIVRSTLSTIVCNAGHNLDRIANGGDCSTGNFEKIVRFISDDWPAELEWPADIERPISRAA